MDTSIELTVYGKNADAAIAAAEAEIYRVESVFSAERRGSEIVLINDSAGKYIEVSAETAELIAFSKDVSKKTDGAFDISVYPAVRAWGFVSGAEHRVPDIGEIDELKPIIGSEKISVDGNNVKLDKGMAIGMGAVAKGYAGSRAAEAAKQAGAESALLILGGNVVCIGAKPDGKPWKIGIQHPEDAGEYFGTVECVDKSIVTSGDYQRYFEEDGKRYHHIIDAKTAAPAETDIASVTVICEDGALADALSTALFVMGSQRAIEYWRANGGFEMVLMLHDGSMIATNGANFTPVSGCNATYI